MSQAVTEAVARVVVGILVRIIRVYRTALVPFVGPSCRFEPSCSRYAEEALVRHGVWRGAALAAFRVCRCQPFSRGGLDPVPKAARKVVRAEG